MRAELFCYLMTFNLNNIVNVWLIVCLNRNGQFIQIQIK